LASPFFPAKVTAPQKLETKTKKANKNTHKQTKSTNEKLNSGKK